MYKRMQTVQETMYRAEYAERKAKEQISSFSGINFSRTR